VAISLNSVMRATCTVYFILVALSTFVMFDENYTFLTERRSSLINIPAFYSCLHVLDLLPVSLTEVVGGFPQSF
jgi:hypothetical protein